MSISAHLHQSLVSPGADRKRRPGGSPKEEQNSERAIYLADDQPEQAKLWDRKRMIVDLVREIYATSEDARLERYAERMALCSGYLKFDVVTEGRYKLAYASFCRVPGCPVCQWRRALMWKCRFMKALPVLKAEYPKARWLHLTLTVKNCKVKELGQTLTAMNKAWNRFTQRDEFKYVKGWIRTAEVTRPEDSTMAHPHFHCLLMVSTAYFSMGYVSQKKWVAAWRRAAFLDYDPSVHVTTVKPRVEDIGEGGEGTNDIALMRAAAEVLKYAVKPEDMVRGTSGLAQDPDWYREFTLQRIKRRLIASGGALKRVLRDLEEEYRGETSEELVQADAEPTPEPEAVSEAPSAPEVVPPPLEEPKTARYLWSRSEKKYRRVRKAEVPSDQLEPPHPARKMTKAEKLASAIYAGRSARTAAQAERAMKRVVKLKKQDEERRRRTKTPDAS